MAPSARISFRQFAALLLVLALLRLFVQGIRSVPGLHPPDRGRLHAVRLELDALRPEEWALLPGLGEELGRRAHTVWRARRELEPAERLLAVPGIGERTQARILLWLDGDGPH